MYLSKSKYTRGMQCPKMLWMEKNMPEQFDESVLDKNVLEAGSRVGDLAMGYFGDYVEVPFEADNFDSMLERTRELLKAETPVICEATFSYEGNFCMADILRKVDGGYELIEVKSSTCVKDVHYDDLAYQLWVLEHCGINVLRAMLMHVDNGYVREGELDLHGLFKLVDLTEDVRAMQGDIEGNVRSITELACSEEEPYCAICADCLSPHECGYRKWCWRNVASPSVFDISRIRKDRAFRMYEEGIESFDDLVKSGRVHDLTPTQQMQVLSHVDELPDYINVDGIKEFLDELSYPLYFLDFETVVPAVPPFEGTHPYQQIPTQYSLHIMETPGGPLEHREFLAQEGTDPRRALAERLVEDIPAGACVLAWNMSFEKGRITELAQRFCDLSDGLICICSNMKDLIDPFRHGYYYSNAMHGSNSIKAVLPALFPDDPELDYTALEGVHNGGEAANAFETLAGRPPEEIAQIREQLLSYCELDTLAMVRILEKLYEVVE